MIRSRRARVDLHRAQPGPEVAAGPDEVAGEGLRPLLVIVHAERRRTFERAVHALPVAIDTDVRGLLANLVSPDVVAKVIA